MTNSIQAMEEDGGTRSVSIAVDERKRSEDEVGRGGDAFRAIRGTRDFRGGASNGTASGKLDRRDRL